MVSPREQAKGLALLRRRFAPVNYAGTSLASPDLQPPDYDAESQIDSVLAKRPIAAALGSIGRVVLSSLLALFFVGLALLAAFPALSYTRQELARYYSYRAEVSYEAQDFSRSVIYWQRSIRAEPADPNAHFALAKAYEGLGADEEALGEYQLAIKMNPQFYDAYLAAAGIHLVKRRDYTSALTEIAQALQQGPRGVRVQSSLYTDLGRGNIGLGQWELAQRNLVHAIYLDPARGSAHCLLAQALEAESKVDWASNEWSICAAMSNQSEVEPQWREQADERLSRRALRDPSLRDRPSGLFRSQQR